MAAGHIIYVSGWEEILQKKNIGIREKAKNLVATIFIDENLEHLKATPKARLLKYRSAIEEFLAVKITRNPVEKIASPDAKGAESMSLLTASLSGAIKELVGHLNTFLLDQGISITVKINELTPGDNPFTRNALNPIIPSVYSVFECCSVQ